VTESFSKWGGAQVHVKNYRKCLWFELATVRSQALKMTSLLIHHMNV